MNIYQIRHLPVVENSLQATIDDHLRLLMSGSGRYADMKASAFAIKEAFRRVDVHPASTRTQRVIARIAVGIADSIWMATCRSWDATLPADTRLASLRVAAQRLPAKLSEAPAMPIRSFRARRAAPEVENEDAELRSSDWRRMMTCRG